MSGPWEDFAPAADIEGPWTQFAPQPATREQLGDVPVEEAEGPAPVDTVPVKVRAAVGAAPTPEGRLLTLRKFYPVAKITAEGDNFTIEDPTHGKLVYNPPGGELGDVASLIPEAGEALGGTVGAALGTTAAGPVGGFAGAGLGAAGGRELATQVAVNTLGTVDPRSLGQVAGQFGTTAALNAGGSVIGAGIGAGLRGGARILFRGGEQGRRQFIQAVADADKWHVPLSVGQAGTALTAAGPIPSAWTLFDNVAPQSAQRLKADAAQKASAELQTLSRQITQKAATRGTSYSAVGRTIREGVETHGKVFRATGHELDQQFFSQVPQDSLVAMPNTIQAVQRAMPDMASLPATTAAMQSAPFGQRLLHLMMDIQNGGGNLKLEDVRALRSQIADQISSGAWAAQVPDIPTIKLTDLHKALGEDIRVAAEATSPAAAAAFNRAQTFWHRELRTMEEVLQPLVAKRVPSEVAKALEGKMKDAPEYVREVMRVLNPKQREVLRSATLANLGQVAATKQGAGGGTWSFDKFLADWNRLDRTTRNILFKDREYTADLDALARTAERLSTKTGAPPIPTYMISGALGAAAMAPFAMAAGGAGGWFILPIGAALTMTGTAAGQRLMRNRNFVHWLGKATTLAPNGITAHIGRLGAIAKNSDPQTQQDVSDFLDVLSAKE